MAATAEDLKQRLAQAQGSSESLKQRLLNAQQSSQPSALDQANQAFAQVPGAAELSEFGSSVTRGAAGVADFFTADPINAALQLAGSESRVPTFQETLAPVTKKGFLEPGLKRDIIQSAGELVAPGGVGGVALRTAARGLPALATASQQTFGQGLTKALGSSTPAQDVTAAVLSGAGAELGEEVAGETGKALGALAAPLAPATLKTAASGLIKTIIRGSNAKGMAKTIDDFVEVGEVPTVAQATGREGQQAVENLSGRVAGGGKIAQKARQVSDSIQSRIKQIADDISPVEGAEAAGLAIKKGITGRGGFLDRFQAKSSDLWNKSDKFISAEQDVAITNIKSKLGELVRSGKIGEILDNPTLAKLKGVFDDVDSIDYKTLRDIRSSIGRKLSNKDLISDIPRAELKQVYRALSEDIKQVARNTSPEALKAFERANAFTRTGHNRLDDFVGRITSKVEVNKIFDAVTKGGEGTKIINSFKRSLRPEEWEIVVSNVIRKLGTSTAGQQNAAGDAFSVNKFLTDWNKLGTAKNSLLSGTKKLEQYRNSLNKIARVSETVKESAKAAANPSGTGQFITNVGIAGGVAGASAAGNLPLAAGILSTVAMNNVGARLMTSPNFVRWLSKNATHTGKITASQLTELSKIANGSNIDDATAIQTLIEEIE